MGFPQAAEATSVGTFDPLTHPHTHNIISMAVTLELQKLPILYL